MAADLFSKSLKLRSQDRVRILGDEVSDLLAGECLLVFQIVVGGCRVCFLKLRIPETHLLDRIFGGIAFGTDNLIHSVVRPRRHDIVGNEHGLAIFRADESVGLVSILEVIAFLACFFLNSGCAVEGLRVHCNESFHAVASVNVQHLADRAEAMSWVNIAFVCPIEFKSPIIPVCIPEWIQVVQI